MKEPQEPIVIHAEALHDGNVLITFADACCAIYSTPLLRSMLPITARFVDKELQEILEVSALPSDQATN